MYRERFLAKHRLFPKCARTVIGIGWCRQISPVVHVYSIVSSRESRCGIYRSACARARVRDGCARATAVTVRICPCDVFPYFFRRDYQNGGCCITRVMCRQTSATRIVIVSGKREKRERCYYYTKLTTTWATRRASTALRK